jgi:predicted O-linked N-acetylglucosamine transferase (SPINDLY family)
MTTTSDTPLAPTIMEQAQQQHTALIGLEARAHALLSKRLWQDGLFDEAAGELDRAIALVPDVGWRIRRALLMPPVVGSQDDIDATRRDCETRLTALMTVDPTLDDPVRRIDWTSYLLSYHGDRDNGCLNRLLHAVCARAAPGLDWRAPHCDQPRSPGPPRVGFLSWFLGDHTISRLFGGLMERIDPESFAVTVFGIEGNDAFLRQGALHGKAAVTLPADLDAARRIIADHRLDLLVYLDLGMDPFTLFLAHARLAPTQAVLWGHPDTTGIANIDVFLSCDVMEPEDGTTHYAERLVRLPGPGCWYPRPDLPAVPPAAADYGLPADALLYLCPQTPQKFHSDFDPVIRKILGSNDKAHLVLTAGWAQPLMERVRQRITAPIPDLAGRIHILGPLERSRFIGLMMLCDVLLDPPHYSGGNTALEAFAVGAPIVTWPGRFMRARHTAGFYRLMGLTDLVATDLDDYARIAIDLGRRPDKRTLLRQAIALRSATLYQDDLVVRAFEAFAYSTLR